VSTEALLPKEKHYIKRMAERGSYDRASIDSVLDASLIGHVGFIHEGCPVVIPMAIWRAGEYLHIHSANKGRLASVCAGSNLCVSIAHLDGLVLARSAYNHSLNYRSLIIHGVAEAVLTPEEKLAALRTLVERLYPGRWDALRPVTGNELQATVVLRLALDRAAVKVRTGMPGDEHDDPGWPIWTGILPVEPRLGHAIPDPTMPPGLPIPEYVSRTDVSL
jgi:nitroimidazol reductase NimA-like FMN-containing flavoprotein (pyridoxamine 5'-phosphate oxidase superfamily)